MIFKEMIMLVAEEKASKKKAITLKSVTPLERELARMAGAKNKKEFDLAIKRIFKLSPDAEWKYLGDNRNNYATSKIGSGFLRAATERLGNSEESILDQLYYDKHGEFIPDAQHYSDPREASNDLLGIKDLNGDELFTLSSSILLIKYNKDGSPTFEIRDNGCGMSQADMKGKFLRQFGESKQETNHARGKWGMGGLAILAQGISDGTSIFTRVKGSDFCIVTAIRYVKEQDLRKTGSLKYLAIDGELPEIPVEAIFEADNKSLPSEVKERKELKVKFEINEDRFPHGTSIKHHACVALGKYTNFQGGPDSSLYQAFNNMMMEPLCPARVEDRSRFFNKSGEKVKLNDFTRPIYGLKNVLQKRELKGGDKIKHYKKATFSAGKHNGRWNIEYWVVDGGINKKGEKKNSPTTLYTQLHKPIIITLFGQNHGTIGHGIIQSSQNGAELPYLSKKLIINCIADELAGEYREMLFSSDREHLVKGEVYDFLHENLKNILKEDPKLDELNDDYSNASLKSGKLTFNVQLQKKIARIFKWSYGKNLSLIGPGTSDKNVKTDKITICDPPTFIEFANSRCIEFSKWRDKRKKNKISQWIGIRTNAPNTYHDPGASSLSCIQLSIINGKTLVKCSGSSSLDDGKMSFKVELTPRAKIGSAGKFRVDLFADKEKTQLIDSKEIDFLVREKKIIGETNNIRNKKKKGRSKRLPLPNLQPISKGDNNWGLLETDDILEASFKPLWGKDKSTIKIYYSKDFPDYKSRHNNYPKKYKDAFQEEYELQLFVKSLYILEKEKIQGGVHIDNDAYEDECNLSSQVYYYSIMAKSAAFNASLHIEEKIKINKLEQ